MNRAGIPCFALGKAGHAPAIYSSMAALLVVQATETVVAGSTNPYTSSCGEWADMVPILSTAIEHGDAPIHAAELELLLDYLNIPAEQVWPALAPIKGPQVVVTLEPGEVVNVLVKHSMLSDDRNRA